LGLIGISKLRKDELIEAISEADKDAVEEPEEEK
jgi:hypothetical protein